MELKSGSKGSITVEAAIVIPTVFFSVLAVLYLSLLLYQQVHLQSLADRAAESEAAIWSSPSRDMYISRITQADMKERDPYWRFIDMKSQEKRSKIAGYTNLQINAMNVLKSIKTEIGTPELIDRIVYKKLRITIVQTYRIPGGGFLRAVGLSDEFTLKARSESVISEPAEFIRNTDFILEVGKELDQRTGGNVEKLGSSIKSVFSNLMIKFNKLAEKIKNN